MATSECALCGEVFTSVSAFDQHQQPNYGRKPPVICRPPAEAGLVQRDDGRWHFPQNAAGAIRVANLKAERAAGVVRGRAGR